jgi:hypothetical protein
MEAAIARVQALLDDHVTLRPLITILPPWLYDWVLEQKT